jgi:hypothetical protein
LLICALCYQTQFLALHRLILPMKKHNLSRHVQGNHAMPARS